MFVGHGLLAFAIAALLARAVGLEGGEALRIGLVAALFGTLPDVDIVYGLTGLAGIAAASGPMEAFFEAGNQIHRGVTHSLLVGGATAAAAGLVARETVRPRRVGVAVLAGFVAMTFALSGVVAGAIAALFVIVALVLVAVGLSLGLSSRAIAGAALLGLVSHPFGDLFTGSPPAFFYPLDVTVLTEHVPLAGDPTLHLLGAFWVELATIWLALLVVFALTGRSLRGHVNRRAALGVGYAAAAVTIPAPTLEVASPFVVSVLAVGAVTAAPRSISIDDVRPWNAVATGLAAVTLASLAYALVYVVA